MPSLDNQTEKTVPYETRERRAWVLKDGRDRGLTQENLSWAALAGFVFFACLRERLVVTSDSSKVGWPKV